MDATCVPHGFTGKAFIPGVFLRGKFIPENYFS
jgi:hypothetical protein